MPKNPVTDPITDQEMAFAHLVLSGTMNDRKAAEAVGLNPDTAAYTKSKPRVRDYMIEHRAAVREKLVHEEAEGLRSLSIGRDQILTRLWELANLSPEATRGSMAGQIKALSMIVAIEGLIPDRRLSPSAMQSAAPSVQPYVSEWLRNQQNQAEAAQPADVVTAVEIQPGTQPASEPEPPPRPINDAPSFTPEPNRPSMVNPFVHPERLSRVPDATGFTFEALLNTGDPLRLPFSPKKRPFARGR